MSDSLRDVTRAVKDQADIVAVVGRHVTLKKAGATYKGLCPFHKEKTPSFNVVPAKNIFHCFGCGAGGSVIDFVMKVERLEFIEALRKLAGELGIEMPAAGPPEERAARDAAESRQRSLRAVNEFALQWFRENLERRRHPAANDYLATRDITPEMAKAFQLGAALEGWDHLAQAARARGYSDELLVDAGLCVRSDRGSVYDRFRARLIFPIHDHLGRIIGFGGRRLDDDPNSPKYLNSAETELYKKGRSLYALNLAQKSISDSGYAILTEGYMDTLMAHRFGFVQAVASLGTALTADQARLLKRYAPRVYFLYDGDEAGRKAMLRGGEPLLAAGLDTRVIALPDGEDPDSFLRREGPDALRARLDGAPEYFDFAVEALAAELELNTIAGQTALVERAAPLFAASRNEIQREAALTRLHARLPALPREAVRRILEQKRHAATKGEQTAEAVHAPSIDFDRLEYYALKLMLENFEALQILRRELPDFHWQDQRLAPWLVYLQDGEHDGNAMITEAQESGEAPAPMSIITAALADTQPIGDPKHSAGQIAARLKRRNFIAIARQIVQELEASGRLGEFPKNELERIKEEHRLAFRTRVPRAPIDVV